MSSFVIAAVFVVFGLWCFVAIPRFLQIFAELGMEMPLYTRLVLRPAATGWWLASWILAALVVWKDVSHRALLRNSVFVVVLALEILTIITALFLPLTVIGPGLGDR